MACPSFAYSSVNMTINTCSALGYSLTPQRRPGGERRVVVEKAVWERGGKTAPSRVFAFDWPTVTVVVVVLAACIVLLF